MSTSKLDTSGVFQGVKVETASTQLTLPSTAIKISSSGIVFRTESRISPWTEMTVDLQSPGNSKKVRCRGVVVECHGNRHSGYMVSMVFMNLSRLARERLSEIAFSRLA